MDVKVNERNEGANDRTKDRRREEQGREGGGRIFKMKLSCLGQNRFYDSAPLHLSVVRAASPSCREARSERPMR